MGIRRLIMNKMIKKIELDLGGKKVSLTPEQAKNLKAALDELFGKEVIREIHEIHEHHDDYPWSLPVPPYQPIWWSTTTTIPGANWRSNTGTLRLTA